MHSVGRETGPSLVARNAAECPFAFTAPVGTTVSGVTTRQQAHAAGCVLAKANRTRVSVQGWQKDSQQSAFGSTLPMLRCRGSGKQRSWLTLRRVGLPSPTQPLT